MKQFRLRASSRLGWLALLCGVAIAGLWWMAGGSPVQGAGRASWPPEESAAKVSPWVFATVSAKDELDFLVVLDRQADLRVAYGLADKQARGRYVRDQLWTLAQESQAPLRGWLDARKIPYRAYYIVNMIHVLAGDRDLVDALAARPEVARIEANPRIRNLDPQPAVLDDSRSPRAVEWNILQVNADDVWQLGYAGDGIVVGGQDTGYDWDHPALVRQYRGWDGVQADHDYNWYDAISNSTQPVDPYGHGTHTMGTILGDDGGDNQIGVAPGARWIGCRNMDSSGVGTPASYIGCFEFFLAPFPIGSDASNGDPDLAPDVTNNSWSCPTVEGCSWDTLQAAVEAQRAAGIMTVSSAGNTGSSCSTVFYPPALYDAAYSVGAVSSSDLVAAFSARGPVLVDGSGRLKPDLVAPGVDIRSAIPGGLYQGGWQGTSMASPHVAGAVALLWSAQPALRNQISETERILNASAVSLYSSQCGDPADVVPNNVYGWGRLDVLAAVQLALASPTGRLTGTVTDQDGIVAGAGITATLEAPTGISYTTTSGADGKYLLQVISGTFAVDVSAAGYLPFHISGITVGSNATTTLDFTLSYSPTCVVSGALSYQPPQPRVGEATLFSGTVAAASLPISYTWSFDDGTFTQTGNPIIHRFPLTTTVQTYSVSLTLDNACQSPMVLVERVTVRPYMRLFPLFWK